MTGSKILFFFIIALFLLPGCSTTSRLEPPTIVPVAVQAEPPAELLEPIEPPMNVFVAPGDPAAVACIDPDGRDAMVRYVDALRARVRAWSAWALTPEGQ